ncbi:MAG: phosphatase PAP2 family protein [Verrucomicrobia bacterium]|nr:phosphatase PAP2 family protein [Verrucomicrobiota bacterium]
MKRYTFVDHATQGYIAFVALLVLVFHGSRLSVWPWLVLAHALGVLLIHLLIQVEGKFPKNQLLEFFRQFYPIPLFVAFYRETELLNQMFYTGYWDAHFLKLEARLFGMQPGLEMLERFPARWLAELLYAAYFSYYLMVAGVGFVLWWRDRRQFAHFVSVVSFMFYVCYTIYIFVPVVGPRIVYAGLVQEPLPQDMVASIKLNAPASVQAAVFFRLMGWIYDHFEAAGAAFPSSHVAVALCTLYFSFQYLRRIRFVHLIAVILLCVATVYGRYHYVVDVVAGIALAAVLLPLGNWLYHKFGNGKRELSATADSVENCN